LFSFCRDVTAAAGCLSSFKKHLFVVVVVVVVVRSFKNHREKKWSKFSRNTSPVDATIPRTL
jgi:hypothetical protein